MNDSNDENISEVDRDLLNAGLLWSKIRPYRWSLAICLVLMVLESATVLVMPWMGGRVFQGLFAQSSVSVGVLAVALIALLFIQSLLQIVQRRVLQRSAEKLTAGLRIDLYDHIQRLPLPWLEDQRRGNLLALIIREVDILSEFVTGTLLQIVPQMIVLVGAILLMLSIDPILTVPVILGVPFFYLGMKLMTRKIRPLAGEIRSAFADYVSLAEENLSILQAIKAFAREDIEADRFKSNVAHYVRLKERMITHQSLIGPLMKFIAASSVVLVLWLAGEKLVQGTMGPAELFSFLLYAGLLTRPVGSFADLWGQFQQARGALHHMSDVLAVRAEPKYGVPLPRDLAGALRFEDVRFQYPGRAPLLRNVDFHIAAGQTVALLGKNGAGKSTLVDVLMRFKEPDGGRILLDGIDISSVALSSYRQAIALVPQRGALINGTVAENIRFGLPGATREDIELAAREADVTSFVEDLPDGLDTQIGEGGIRLSGGQRQRVALARALVKKPAILVLDEPTAMFDPESETRFVEIARNALADRTVILITHRPASVELADRIFLLEGGCVREEENNADAEKIGAHEGRIENT